MSNRRNTFFIVTIVIFGCIIMGWVDSVLSPNYRTKSIIKLFTFLLLPIGFIIIKKDITLKDLFKIDKRSIKSSLILGVGVYFLIVFGYLLLQPLFDFSNITGALENNIGVNKNNFIYVAFYISFFNSLLEEFFFRGFAYLTLKRFTSRIFANIFSATAFSIYHFGIMKSWFSPILYFLLIISLFIAGLLFNWLNQKKNNIYPSWFVHIFANLGINTIGLILFDII
ncbi:MAG TPA: CPBP family intramembrane metalloprotease [Eubacteriaceae bacterium]|jgi:membrane protease YdiL (CAAX protease family)|nr:CPBP family intramembrane metalloprotease [Eubacteriaceae bacterium]